MGSKFNLALAICLLASGLAKSQEAGTRFPSQRPEPVINPPKSTNDVKEDFGKLSKQNEKFATRTSEGDCGENGCTQGKLIRTR